MESVPGGEKRKSRFDGMTDEQVIAAYKSDEANYMQPNPGGSEREAYFDSRREMEKRGLPTDGK